MEESRVSYTHTGKNNQDPKTSLDLNPFLEKISCTCSVGQFWALPGTQPSLRRLLSSMQTLSPTCWTAGECSGPGCSENRVFSIVGTM